LEQAFRVYRDKVAISMNYFINGSTAHQTCSGLERCIDLLTNHQFSFVQGVTTTGHQLHHPKGDHTNQHLPCGVDPWRPLVRILPHLMESL
jgi:hypothetical protein